MKQVVATAVAAQAIGGGMGWSLAAALMPEMAKELGIGAGSMGLVWGAASLGIAIASPLGGVWTDKYGARRVGGIAMLFGAAMCAARIFCVGPKSLALAMLLFGLHIGFVAPSVPKALAAAVPMQKLARANGLALLGYTITTALMMLGARTLLSPVFGWRGCMLLAAGLMTCVALAWLRFVRDGAAGRHGAFAEMLGLAKHPGLARVAAMHFVIFGGYLALLGILPHVLGKSGGPAIAAWLLFAAAANFAGPWISDRIGSRRIVLAAGTFVCGAALLAFAITRLPFLLPIAALGGGAVAPLLLTLPLEMEGVGPARAGSALGLLMLVGQIGGFLLPAASSAMGGRHGFGAALTLLAVAHLLAILPGLGFGSRRDALVGSAT